MIKLCKTLILYKLVAILLFDVLVKADDLKRLGNKAAATPLKFPTKSRAGCLKIRLIDLIGKNLPFCCWVNMAANLFPSVSSVANFFFQVLMEHFDDPAQLQEAVNCSRDCSEDCATLLKYPATTPLSEPYTVHPRGHLDETHIATEEFWRLEKATNNGIGLLEETKRAVYVVKEMRQRVQNRMKQNVGKTREIFNTLRRVIDQREEQVIAVIKEDTDKRDKALKVLLLYCLQSISGWLSNKNTQISREQNIIAFHWLVFSHVMFCLMFS